MPKSPVPSKKSRLQKRKRGRPRRLSAIELAERRQAVLTMRLKGLTLQAISKRVGVGYMTVKRDLDLIRQENLDEVSKFNSDVALGQALASYNQIEREAWLQYHRASHGTTQRAHFLNLVRAAVNDRLKVLTDVGLISRAAVKVEHTVEADGVLKGWTQDAKQLVAMAIIRAQMDGSVEGGNGEGREILELPAHMVEPAPSSEKREEGGGNGV